MIAPGRRTVLGTTAGLALLAAGCGGGDDDGGGLETVSIPEVGITVDAPGDWEQAKDETSVTLTSKDKRIVVTVSSPLPGQEPKQVKEAVARQLATTYAPAKLAGQNDKAKLGNRTARSFEITGVQDGKPVNAVAIIEDTKYRTYAVTAVTLSLELPEKFRPTKQGLEQLQAVLQSVRLTKPTRT